MSPLHLSIGDSLVLWVQDRGSFPSPTPVAELIKGLNAIGLPCESRNLSDLGPFEAILSPLGGKAPTPFRGALPGGEDAFAISASALGLRLIAPTWRGLVYAIWELMESFGWSWPTPEGTREPEVSSWLFEEGKKVFRARLKRRILFLEQVDLSPEVVLWLSRQRFNTLFPSNPARFKDPEHQVPDLSVARAQGLGFDFIVGGDSLPWLLEDHLPGSPKKWGGLTGWERKEALGSIGDLLREMRNPRPRLSLWPDPGEGDHLLPFLDQVREKFPDQGLETALEVRPKMGDSKEVLFHLREEAPSPHIDSKKIEKWIERRMDGSSEEGVYFFFDASPWDNRLGRVLDSMLWRRQYQRLQSVFETGLEGMALSLHDIDLAAYLDRGAFALATLARGMWNGPGWDPRPYARDLIHQQFEGAGPIVETLTLDFERWADQVAPPSIGDQDQAASPQSFYYARQILQSEQVRDKLDQRISEIEESAPCETCLELARSLSTLVGLFDLEECTDSTEAKAMARTIWQNNHIDQWPQWLQASSPLVERLRSFL